MKDVRSEYVAFKLRRDERRILERAAVQSGGRLSDIARDGSLTYARALLAHAKPADPGAPRER